MGPVGPTYHQRPIARLVVTSEFIGHPGGPWDRAGQFNQKAGWDLSDMAASAIKGLGFCAWVPVYLLSFSQYSFDSPYEVVASVRYWWKV